MLILKRFFMVPAEVHPLNIVASHTCTSGSLSSYFKPGQNVYDVLSYYFENTYGFSNLHYGFGFTFRIYCFVFQCFNASYHPVNSVEMFPHRFY